MLIFLPFGKKSLILIYTPALYLILVDVVFCMVHGKVRGSIVCRAFVWCLYGTYKVLDNVFESIVWKGFNGYCTKFTVWYKEHFSREFFFSLCICMWKVVGFDNWINILIISILSKKFYYKIINVEIPFLQNQKYFICISSHHLINFRFGIPCAKCYLIYICY